MKQKHATTHDPGLRAFFMLLVILSLATACRDSTTPTSHALPTTTAIPAVVVTATEELAPNALPTQAATNGIVTLPVPPERDLYDLARRLAMHSSTPITRLPSPIPPTLKVGDMVEWKVNRDEGNVTVGASVRLVTGHAYWVFEDRFVPDRGRLQRAADDFESNVWHAVTDSLGTVWTPGIDGDPRIVIFHGKLRSGVGGYFSSVDEYPVSIRPDSNQREVIYISADAFTLGGTAYLGTLAHELQHAIHWAADPGEDAWVNEGISEVAAGLAGFPAKSPPAFLRQPDTSLTQWEPEIFQASPNYGGAALFFEYMASHFGGTETLKAIIENQSDGIASVDAVLTQRGYNLTTRDVFVDWVVANYVDDDSGPYSYPMSDYSRPRTTYVTVPDTVRDSVHPFGTNYYTLQDLDSGITVNFRGTAVGNVLPATPYSGHACWWSNAGDSIDTTLTRAINLTGASEATFEFMAWYAIEEDWDYAYVEVSTDGGMTWQILPTGHASTANPNGTAYGPGITGQSEGWVKESVDLTQYAGSEILIRLEYITDDAIHDRGACFDDFAIAEIGWSDAADDSGDWISEGFALINNQRPVEYLVQVIRDKPEGPSQVQRIFTGLDGSGNMSIAAPETGETVIVAVSVVTPGVAGSVGYSISFDN
jgi:immune inhibitor A